MNTEPDLAALHRQHLAWLGGRNYSPRTIDDRDHSLRHFLRWLAAEGRSIDPAALEAYAHYWAGHRKSNGQPLSGHTRRMRMIPPKMFCRWLVRIGHLTSDPTTTLEPCRLMHSLPRCILSHAEVERVLQLPNLCRRNGLRDRTVLEVLYATGIRRAELASLRLCDLDLERALLMVRRGKGGKDRLIPMGKRAAFWLHRYLVEWRPRVAGAADFQEVVFLTERGSPLAPRHLTWLVGRNVRQARLGKTGSCHTFRHTMATLMLENGADIRFLQEQLGHASLQTTQLYTRVAVRHLQKVHARTHPAEIAFRRTTKIRLPEASAP